MSEKRKADLKISISTPDGKRHNYEIFSAEQFLDRLEKVPFFHAEQPDLMILPLDLQYHDFVRVQLNGRWVPEGRRAFYQAHRVSYLIGQHVMTHIRKERDE